MTRHHRSAAGMVAVCAITLAACASPGASGTSSPDPEVDRPAPDSPHTEDLARALNDTGFAIFRAAAEEGENTTVSPLSIGTAFGMLNAGATEPVAGALDEAFAWPVEGPQLLDAFNSLDQRASSEPADFPSPGQDEPVHAVVRIANRMFLDEGFEPQQDYRERLAASFDAGAQVTPMSTDPEQAADAINGWVDDRTEGLIPELVTPEIFDDQSRLVLANALYMKAEWAHQFEEFATADEPFTLPGGDTADVPMMNSGIRNGTVHEGEGFVSVVLPYAYDELEMVVVVPDDGAFEDVRAALGQDTLDQIDSAPEGTGYTLAMPRFTAESRTDLRAVMEGELGIEDLFGVVGLDGIAPDMYVSAAVHATKVIVDEAGTEAAAATAIVAGTTSMPAPPEFEIRADRPFLYVIRDNDTGAVLFVGQVLDPR
ncbi:serpin family protein [Demequina sp. TTPB684]|uniref:serpin family protein n=1 Tax=unclassified Demequina TaxID=2620311 RepID=UPI001CF5831A|nr:MULTISPECIES: serpin family protein [unclassified Demequina]MCB2411728.1 serpin family protein [Demequina sp. TTPB684]UPU87628.1 serpin family protein [Demequina sp. TMPB413]